MTKRVKITLSGYLGFKKDRSDGWIVVSNPDNIASILWSSKSSAKKAGATKFRPQYIRS